MDSGEFKRRATASVPRSVEMVSNDREELGKLASPQFNPAEIAYVESPVNLPDSCRGLARITNETPTQIMVSVQMKTAGLVVLADNWDKGWRAVWNGKPVPVLEPTTRFAASCFRRGTRWNLFTSPRVDLGFWLRVLVWSFWQAGGSTTGGRTRFSCRCNGNRGLC